MFMYYRKNSSTSVARGLTLSAVLTAVIALVLVHETCSAIAKVTKFIWKVVTNFNLNPPLKLFFYLPILTNNNLLLKIYYENIVATFFKIFYPLYYFSCLSLHFIHTFFFFTCFSPPHVVLISIPLLLLLCLRHSRTF